MTLCPACREIIITLNPANRSPIWGNESGLARFCSARRRAAGFVIRGLYRPLSQFPAVFVPPSEHAADVGTLWRRHTSAVELHFISGLNSVWGMGMTRHGEIL